MGNLLIGVIIVLIVLAFSAGAFYEDTTPRPIIGEDMVLNQHDANLNNGCRSDVEITYYLT